MSLYGKQAFQFGLKKESVRLTAEASPAKWYPVFDPEITYGPNLLEDNALRGVQAPFAPVAGRKLGTGKFKLYLDPQVMGEFLVSLIGGVASAQQGGTAAYQHTFTPAARLSPTTYTFFLNWGLDVKKYNGCVVKSLNFTGPVDGLVMVEVEFLFITEAAGSIGSPSFPTQRYLAFQHTDFKIAGSSNTDVRQWGIKIDNQAIHHLTHSLSQDAQDILTPGQLLVSGDMIIYFQSETERNKFLANTGVALRALIVGATIASTFKWTMDLPLTDAHYKAYPFGYEQDLLAAKATFDGYHNGTSQIIPVLINTDTAY
jgi:hypothetical protein